MLNCRFSLLLMSRKISEMHQIRTKVSGNQFVVNLKKKKKKKKGVTFRVRPQEVTHWPIVRHFLFPIDGSDLVQSLDGGREATVHTENLQRKEGPQSFISDFD